ncbi:type I glyceraldehyde-3-phosphate dehydrogenase [Pasteuria penetrans]|uniref:type I glyceraldehyde-3-phosphate dehydrogenase n=1 Tax=Pasteuria penetrans TaxID=86005 RepID=UPI000FA02AC9|nr:type I glyceraldehyde-3-phosphate dehydrogenase [Pasteuria penetrans]
MGKLGVGINGFGRIGRRFFRALWGHPRFQVTRINDLGNAATLAHLLQYDSVHGKFTATVRVEGDTLWIDDRHKVHVSSQPDPAQLAWGEHQVAYVVESTGRYTQRADAMKHLTGGVERVIISAPTGDADWTVVMGVNEGMYDPGRHRVLSNASCTTNGLAPVVKILHDYYDVLRGSMTTIHAYTNDQQILDLPHKDLRRARAAGLSIIPTTTGAARAISEVIPSLAGRLEGSALRVPVSNVSIIDLVVQLAKPTNRDELNALFQKEAAKSEGVLAYSTEPLVSVDYNGDTHSATVDALSTAVVGDHLAHVVAWYDNESGYVHRLIDLLEFLSTR